VVRPSPASPVDMRRCDTPQSIRKCRPFKDRREQLPPLPLAKLIKREEMEAVYDANSQLSKRNLAKGR
jgi:hypothetical protein